MPPLTPRAKRRRRLAALRQLAAKRSPRLKITAVVVPPLTLKGVGLRLLHRIRFFRRCS